MQDLSQKPPCKLQIQLSLTFLALFSVMLSVKFCGSFDYFQSMERFGGEFSIFHLKTCREIFKKAGPALYGVPCTRCFIFTWASTLTTSVNAYGRIKHVVKRSKTKYTATSDLL